MAATAKRLGMVLAFLAAGCASAPPPPPLMPSIPQNARIAYAVGKFDPVLEVDSGGGALASKGAAEGMSQCMRGGGGAGSAPAAILLAALALVCLPIGALVGASVGAALSPSREARESAEAKIGAASKALDFPGMLSFELEQYGRRIGIAGLSELRAQGPKSITDIPRYELGPDYVIEISITSAKAFSPGTKDLPYALEVSASGRLIRVADNVVIDSFSRSIRTRARTVHQWTADGTVIMRSLRGAVQTLSQSFIDEWYLIYREDLRDPIARSVRADPQVPDYVLRPRGSIVGSTSTTLNWQALPATLPEQYFAGNQARARNVVYDVMLFRAGARGRPVPAELVRSYDGITLPTVRVGPLAACTRYFWTVRARFELDGRMRVSEWSGAYNLGETPDPRSERRGLRGFDDVPVGAFYYWFVTSGFDGIPCPRRA